MLPGRFFICVKMLVALSGADAADVFAVLGVHVAEEECVRRRRECRLCIAQRRQVDVEHVETEEEVLAHLTGADGFFGIFVRCCEHTDIDGRLFITVAEAADFGDPRERVTVSMALAGRGHFANFVEKKRAAVGQFEAADATFGCAGEGSALVAENFAFHQRFGNRGAIDGDKGAGGARRELVDATRDDFFSRAGFTGGS